MEAYYAQKRSAVNELKVKESELTKIIAEKKKRLDELDEVFVKRGKEYGEMLQKNLSTIETAAKGIDPKLDELLKKYYTSIDVRVDGFLKDIAKVLKDATTVRDYVHEVFADASRLRNMEALVAMMSGLNVNPSLLYIELIALIGGARESFSKTGDNRLAEILEGALVEMRKVGGPIGL